MFQPDYTPVAHSLGWSAAVAALPLVIMFVLLGGLRMRAPIAAAVGVGTAALIAWGVYHMPAAQVADSAALGFAYGMFPIMWLVLNAIWIYNLTVQTGHRDVLCRSMASISPDHRIQAVIVAFCFGALIEGLAGFGTPVAITSLMLVALRFSPLKAAAVALVANTAPVAFASLGIPIVALSGVTGLSLDTLGAMVGRQTPILACIVPFILIFMVDGRKGLKQAWPAAAMGGGVYAIVQFLCSNFFSVELTDIAGSIISAGSIVLLLRFWRPKASRDDAGVADKSETKGAAGPLSRPHAVLPNGSVLTAQPASGVRDEVADSRKDVLLAYAPYVMVTVIFSLSMWKPFTALLKRGGTSVSWPGLHVANAAHKASPLTTYKLDFLAAAGTLLLVSGLLTMLVLRTFPRQAARAYAQAAIQLRSAAITVGLVLALAYLLNLSGETTTLGLWIAGAGGLLGIVSPIIGWLGVTVTGSDTSSNSLFGVLQVSAAHAAGLSPTLLAAANSSGGVIGKMLSPQSLVIATAAVQMKGKEGDLFRTVLKWSLLLLALMCVLVYLQSTPWLGWMVV